MPAGVAARAGGACCRTRLARPILVGRPRQADGADEQAHPGLLLGEDVLDVGAHGRLPPFARPVRSGIGRPCRLLAVDVAHQHALAQQLLVLLRPIAGVGPDLGPVLPGSSRSAEARAPWAAASVTSQRRISRWRRSAPTWFWNGPPLSCRKWSSDGRRSGMAVAILGIDLGRMYTPGRTGFDRASGTAATDSPGRAVGLYCRLADLCGRDGGLLRRPPLGRDIRGRVTRCG